MNELELKNQIILKLKEGEEIIKRHVPVEKQKPISEEFIRGFIWGAETMTGLKITPDMEQNILKEFNL